MREINLYTENDKRCAAARLRRCALLFACLLLPPAIVYVLGILNRMRFLMLAALLAGFVCAVFCCDLYLLPALRYASFLKEMESGLRRSLDCTLESVSAEVRKQDGVRVHPVQVRLEDGDGRMFYVNVSKLDMLPPEGGQLQLISYGRHIVAFRLH